MTDFGATAWAMPSTTPFSTNTYPTTTPGLPSGGGGGGPMSGLNGGGDNMGNGGGDGGLGDLPVDLALVVQGCLAALTTGKVVAVLFRRGVKYVWRQTLSAVRKAREARMDDGRGGGADKSIRDVESGCLPKCKFGWQLRIKVELIQFAAGENFPSEEEDSRAGFGTVAVCSSCNNTALLEDTVYVAKKANNSTVLGAAGQKSRTRVQSTPRRGGFTDVEEEVEVDTAAGGDGLANVQLNVPNQERSREQ
jgi:hypothetical protein